MPRYCLLLLLVGIVMGVVLIVSATDTSSDFSTIRVSVEVTSKQHSSEINSYMNHALRNLGDVIVVSANPNFDIRVTHMHDDVGNSNVFGIVVLNPIPDNCFHPDLSEELLSWLRRDGFIYEGSKLVLSGLGVSLKQKCEEIVADLDGQIFEKHRQVFMGYNGDSND